MKHVHFDLDQIERDVRKMYASTPADFIHPNPAVADLFRKADDVEVAFVRWFFNNQMAGADPLVQLEAIVSIFSTLIMNRVRSIGSDGGQEPVLDFIMNGIVETVSHAFASERQNGLSDHAIAVSPVISGNA
ncbi:MAG TPA: hypothetical protein VJM50_21200 [Pyrinomonadaceae bacterium]|nr:hypothetical protein [Pyrinomonadaceae bacterium]